MVSRRWRLYVPVVVVLSALLGIPAVQTLVQGSSRPVKRGQAQPRNPDDADEKRWKVALEHIKHEDDLISAVAEPMQNKLAFMHGSYRQHVLLMTG